MFWENNIYKLRQYEEPQTTEYLEAIFSLEYLARSGGKTIDVALEILSSIKKETGQRHIGIVVGVFSINPIIEHPPIRLSQIPLLNNPNYLAAYCMPCTYKSDLCGFAVYYYNLFPHLFLEIKTAESLARGEVPDEPKGEYSVHFVKEFVHSKVDGM